MPRLLECLWVFFATGNTTFGGGDPTMLALRRELVERRGWLSPEQYTVVFALARVTPGTNLLAFAAAAAWYLGGSIAALGATAVMTLPSALLVVWITATYEAFQTRGVFIGGVNSVVAAATGLMAAGSLLLLRPHFASRRVRTACFFALGWCTSHLLGWSPIQVLGLAAVAGYFWQEARHEA